MTDTPGTSPPDGTDLEANVSPAAGSATRVSSDERQSRLAQTVASQVATGMRVESQGPYNAILVKGKPVNHVLHLILTLVTLGFWLIVWIILVLIGGEKRSQVTVDDFGNTSVQQLT